MVGQEIESCYSVTQYGRNPPETSCEIPITRPNEPYIERADDRASCSSEIVHISGQPIFDKRTSEVSHEKSKNNEPQ